MTNNFLTINDFMKKKASELYMTFSLSEKTYAIPAEKIVEIVQLPALQVLERLPEYIVGLMNLRGNIISVLNLRKLLGIKQEMFSTENQVLIINSNDKHIGIIVDSVNDVIQCNKENLNPLPYNLDESLISGIYRDAQSMVAFLDLDLIINNIAAVEIDKNTIVNEDYSFDNLFHSDDVSKEKLKNRAEKLQKEIKTEHYEDNFHQNNFVSFSLNKEIFSIGLKYVKEFCKLKSVNVVPVPCVPNFIIGIFNLRGEFITIIDIKSFLQIGKTIITDKSKIIVAKTPSIQVGLLVDDVFNIVNIPNDKLIQKSSSKLDKHNYTSIQVMTEDGGIMSILDFEKFIKDERLYIEDAV